MYIHVLLIKNYRVARFLHVSNCIKTHHAEFGIDRAILSCHICLYPIKVLFPYRYYYAQWGKKVFYVQYM